MLLQLLLLVFVKPCCISSHVEPNLLPFWRPGPRYTLLPLTKTHLEPVSAAVEKNQVKLLQHLAPKLAATPAVTHPKPFGRHKQGSIWNSAGHTPLTLACSLGHDKAACAMLAAGFSPLQLARVLLPGAGKEQEVHALLLAAQVSGTR